MIITRNSGQIPEALQKAAQSTQSFYRVAAIQMASGPNVKGNLEEASRLIDMACSIGVRIVVLPEYFAIMGMKDTDKINVREKPGDGPIQQWMSETAKKHRIWLIGGSIPMEASVPNKVRNTCLVYNREGEQVARYDKIHLFNLALGSENFSEERTIEAGDKVVVVESPYGRIGLSICYDLRFPELYRAMGDVDIIVVPSASDARDRNLAYATTARRTGKR